MAKNKDIFKIKSPKMFGAKLMDSMPQLKRFILDGDVFLANSLFTSSNELRAKDKVMIQKLHDEYKVDNIAFVVDDSWGMTSYVYCTRPSKYNDGKGSIIFSAYVVNENIGVEESGDVGFIENSFGELVRTV